MAQQTRKIRYNFRQGVRTPPRHFHTYLLANLAADGDLAATVIFAPSQDVRIRSITITPDGSVAGVDDSNTSVWTVASGVGTIVTETFDSSTAFPADNTQTSLGTLANTLVKAGDRLDLTVTNGTTADLPPVVVTIEYSVVDEELETLVPGWVVTRTAAAGDPVVSLLTGGGIRLALSDTTEVQNLCLSFGDALPFDIDELIAIEFIAKTVATLDTATQIALGLASARNDAIDSIAEAALFRCIADNNVVVESDDGTNNNDDVATNLTLGTDWKRFRIDFASRITTLEPPSVSTGRKTNIEFFMGNALGSMRRVADGTRFDMSNYAGGLQPFFQIQKTSDANADTLDLLEVCVEVKLPDFS